jgi:Cu2+-exporting ATPase
VVTDVFWEDQFFEPKLKSVLLAMESQSEHPLAEAVVRYLKEEELKPLPVFDFESITGKGVQAKDAQGMTYFMGNQKLLEDHQIQIGSTIQEKARRLQQVAKTVIYFANESTTLGILAISDKIKATSKAAITQLKHQGIQVYMLTGDNSQTAAEVAGAVGISDFKAEVLPGDKADFVKDLQASGKVVAMVGDGINDSQALAQADVSIAMGKGSDIAMDVAKMTLITADLLAIPKALKLSSKTVLGIRQNLFWAFIYNLIGIPIAAGVLYPFTGFLLDPMIAGGAMALSSVSVVANSLRLKIIKT